MTALSGEELMAWVEKTSERWLALLGQHPEALAIECDIMGTGMVAKLLQHIVAVEIRYAQRLADLPESSYDEVGYGSAKEIFATHDLARSYESCLRGRSSTGSIASRFRPEAQGL